MVADFLEKDLTVEQPQSDGDVAVAVSKKVGTVQDRRDMWRIGRDQELNVCSVTLLIPSLLALGVMTVRITDSPMV
jgi:hypothetical protein